VHFAPPEMAANSPAFGQISVISGKPRTAIRGEGAVLAEAGVQEAEHGGGAHRQQPEARGDPDGRVAASSCGGTGPDDHYFGSFACNAESGGGFRQAPIHSVTLSFSFEEQRFDVSRGRLVQQPRQQRPGIKDL
jgi:hypothetical protein